METINLHGFTLEDAKKKIIQGMEEAYHHQEQVVRIIHGQGKHSEFFPVIKSYVRHWLEESQFGREKVEIVYRGEEGSPYTTPNAGETIVVLKRSSVSEINDSGPLLTFEEEEAREARRNAKAIRADRLRNVRRRNPRFR